MTWRLLGAGMGVLLLPGVAAAAGDGVKVHPASAAPFVLLLATIAALPVFAPHWWHPNRNKGVVVALLAVPTAAYLLTEPGGAGALAHELQGYVSFIILLTALYVISGGVVLRGDLRPTPAVNTTFLAFGAVLANLIGTTGASMLLIRPLLRINARRERRVHVPLFFIFVVSNTGGLLTPLGDPPLFLGFLGGVPFEWTLRLWPQWLLANGMVLAAFVVCDRLAGRSEQPGALKPAEAGPDPDSPPDEPLRIDGAGLNGVLMVGVVGAVLARAAVPFPVAELFMAGLAGVSLWLTPKPLREANAFGWGPMVEVAVLFAGIFVTMVPALALLNEHGAKIPVTRAWEFFWLTGGLSSVLDNAPTYLTMATLAAAGQGADGLAGLAQNHPELLAAISCGAVFMGANSYIGNGPNFMVKAIADESGYRMPSFGKYMLVAAVVLLPVFAVVTVVFFRG